ncbi:MAG: hypothetical protein DRI61_05660 [Chloroflexi bacterium]|nr:MAG: hypothetical protein DRI61_05660 [Chloroflexota bacterium]
MEIEFKGRDIYLDKELTLYDKLALNFSDVLKKHDVNHVYVSGYVALIFGRSRTSEDIDMLVERMSIGEFQTLWNSLYSTGFYCHNTPDCKTAYNVYLDKKIAIRFSEVGRVIPNVEFKWASNEQHIRALGNNLEVHIPGGSIAISSLETQIAFKLLLGSEKDIEDARYLFELFGEHLNQKALIDELAYLEISLEDAKKKLGWQYEP